MLVVVWCGVVWYRVIIVSALSLSLIDKERFRDWEIERAWQYSKPLKADADDSWNVPWDPFDISVKITKLVNIGLILDKEFSLHS